MLTWDDEGELTKAKKLGVAPDTVLNLQKQIICAINAFEPADWLIRYVELHPGKKDSYQKKVRIANDKIVDFFDNHAGERAGTAHVKVWKNAEMREKLALHKRKKVEAKPEEKK